jgi:dTDP-L-rhamnose 4-epimerase
VSERVLITGGAGFIGSHTVDRLLAAGANVRVLDNLHPQVHPGGAAPAHLNPGAELIVGDVRDLDTMRRAVRGVDRVVHYVAETSVGQSIYQPDHHVDVNVRGTAVLFRALREERSDAGRVVLSSSRAVYGEGAYRCRSCGVVHPDPRRIADLEAARWKHPCPQCDAEIEPVATTEDAPHRYSSAYGMTKSFQEEVATAEARLLGIPLVVVRYFNVYGPRQSLDNPYTGLIVTLASRLLGGRPLVLYEDGTPIRDFVHVDDVVWASVRSLTGPMPPIATLNVGSGVGTSLRELVTQLAAAFGREAVVDPCERFRVGDIHAAIADLTRSRAAIGYEPALDLAPGLRTLVPHLEAACVIDRSEAVEVEMRRQGVLRGA